MKTKLLSILFFLLPFFLHAQVILSMKGETIITMNVPISIYVSDVVVAKPEKSYIGFVRRGSMESIVTRPSVKEEILPFLQRSFPKKEGLKPLIIKINEFDIQHEKVAGVAEEIAVIRLALVFLYPTDKPNEYVKKYVYGTSYQLGPNSYVGGVYDVFKAAIKSFLVASQNNELTNIPYSEAEMNELDDFQPEKFAISTANKIKKGVYRSFEQFRNNSPDTTVEITVKEVVPKYFEKDTAYLAKVSFSRGAFADNIWGISTEKGIFVKVNKHFIKIRKSKQDFIIYGKEPLSYEAQKKLEEINTAAFMGGLFGGAILGGIIGGIASISASEEYDFKQARVPYYLSYGNGDFFIEKQKKQEEIYKYAQIVLYHGVASATDKPTKMHIENMEFTLDKGEYTTFRLYIDKQSVPLKIETAKGTYIETNIYPQDAFSQLLILTLKKEDKVKLERLRGSTETDIKNRLQPKAKVEALIMRNE